MLTIVLQLPDSDLWPNRHVYWRRVRKAAKVLREAAGYAAIHAMNEAGMERPRWKRASAKCRYYFREKRKRDGDGALSAAKHAFDGLTDAGVWIDDCGVTHLPVEMTVDREDPRLEIDVTEITDAT